MTNPRPEVSGVRARAKATVRQGIIDAGMRLFAAEGYDPVSTNRIAEAAGVTQRTLFRYFPRKDLIVYGAADEIVAFEEALSGALDREALPLHAILTALASAAAYCEEHRAAMRIFAVLLDGSTSLRSSEFDRQARLEWLCALAMEGEESFRLRKPDPALRYRMMAGTMMGMIRPVVREWRAGAAYSLSTAMSVTGDAIAALIRASDACYERLPAAGAGDDPAG